MRLLKLRPKPLEPEPLSTQRLFLRRPEMRDYDSWALIRSQSSQFLQPWEPKWSEDELSRNAFRARMRRQEADIASGRGLPWFLFLEDDPCSVVGGVSISHIRKGVSQTGTLGYWMGEAHANQGLMREAVITVCRSCFDHHGLHRIEAAAVTNNHPSQALLKRCGFQSEGTARAYLKIANVWRDHHLFALLADDPLVC